jgi:hypothetical protein
MRVLIAAAIFGISCGMYGCSNEANVAGRPMAAEELPVASPGAAIQTAADANADAETPAVVNPPAVIPPTAVNPPVAAPSNWVDVTTVGPNLTLQDPITRLSWSNRRPNATWQGAIDHCSALTYNGVSGWRLPTQTELMNANAHGIKIAARANWMTLANMQADFWSVSSYPNWPNTAWLVYLWGGNTDYMAKGYTNAVVCVR